MWAPRILLCLGVPFALAGCIGEPCGGADAGHPNPQYAGSYSASFSNLSFELGVDAAGNIEGTVTEAGTNRKADGEGYLYDFFYACSPRKTFLNVWFTFDGEALRRIDGTRPLGFVQPWPFSTPEGQIILNRK